MAPYETAGQPAADVDELVERALTLLMVMPANQKRETVEDLLSPTDRDKGRRAVDALIESAFAAEDEARSDGDRLLRLILRRASLEGEMY